MQKLSLLTLLYVFAIGILAPSPSAMAQLQLHSIDNPRLNPNFGRHGYSVAIEGNIVSVGAPREPVGQASESGAVIVYTSVGDILHKIENPSGEFGDLFGHSVAMSGSRTVVGAPGEDTGANDAGSAYVYIPDGNGTSDTNPALQLRNPNPSPSARFGGSVAMSGNFVVVGADRDDTGALDAGIAYVYDIASETPTVPVATLLNPTPMDGDRFGISVALSGTTIIVGAFGDETGAPDAGSAYVFDLNAPDPSVPVLTLNNPAPQTEDWFGYAVSVSASRIVVGAYGDNGGAFNEGSAYVYDLENATPSVPVFTLTNPRPNSANSHFGFAVAINGTRVLIGAPREDAAGTDAGQVYAYDLAGATPTVPTKTLAEPSPTADGIYGASVAINGTLRVVAGAPGSRSAYGYFLNSSSQTQQVYSRGPAASDNFGASVAVARKWMAVGAPLDDTGRTDAGRVHVFDLTSAMPRVPAITLDDQNQQNADRFGTSVALSGNLLVASAPFANEPGAVETGTVYVYNLAGQAPTVPVFTLRNPFPVISDHYGSSVAISGTRVVVGVSGFDDGANASAGRAYVYDLAGGTPEVPLLTLTNPTPATNDLFGACVAISGTRIVVGAALDDTGAPDSGSTYVYDLAGATPEVPVLSLANPSPANAGRFGSAVSISGARVVIGAPARGIAEDRVFIYDIAGPVPTVPVLTLENPVTEGKTSFGSSVAIAGTTVVVSSEQTVDDPGHAYFYDLASATPGEFSMRAFLQGVTNGLYTTAVATDGYYTAVSAPGYDGTSLDSGRAYVYGPGQPDNDHDGLPDIWEIEHFGDTVAHSGFDDTDDDGLNEILEVGFNRDPLMPDATGPVAVNEGGYLTMTMVKRGYMNYTVESAGSLSPGDFSAASTTILINDATTLKVRDNFPIGAAPSRFMRVKLTPRFPTP
jgi:hypothetical protein